MEMNKATAFITKDLYLAAFLDSQNISLMQLQKDDNGDFIWFVFDDLQQCRILESKFWQKETFVCLKDYLNSLKILKQRLFQTN